MDHATIQDKCRGALVGGAVGDALGYEVEFMSLAAIHKRFGDKGIRRYELHNGVAEFSDDTQMTLFTLEGLMNGLMATNAGAPEQLLPYLRKAYLNWYNTQKTMPAVVSDSWLGSIRSLWSRRAPGNTCLSALECIAAGCEVCNSSKGCGGVMRVAPIGLCISSIRSDVFEYREIARIAGLAAEITHKHIASTFAAATLALILFKSFVDDNIDPLVFSWIVGGALFEVRKSFQGHDKEWNEFSNLINRAMELGQSDVLETEAIRSLGEGWVGDEALAIAVFSVMRHPDSFEDCIVCAVNHDGDSDSTGAIAGNIIGASLGYSAIPAHYLEHLEIEPVIVSAADDLCADLKNPEVARRIAYRYENHIPAGIASKYII